MRKRKSLRHVEDMAFFDENDVASATECTGLIPSAAEDETEAEAYEELYSLNKQKPRHL